MVLKVLERSTHKRWKCKKYFHHPILGVSSFTHVSCLLCLASHHSPWGERDHRTANTKPLTEHMSLQWQLREPRTSQSTYQAYPRAKNWFVWTLLFLLHLFSLSHHPSCITPSGHALCFGVNFCRAVFNEVSNLDSCFTSGLKFHQSRESQMGSVRGNNRIQYTWVQLYLCWYQGLLMPELTLALNYCNSSQDFWVASTQSATFITTYIMNVFCTADLSYLWGNCHDRVQEG